MKRLDSDAPSSPESNLGSSHVGARYSYKPVLNENQFNKTRNYTAPAICNGNPTSQRKSHTQVHREDQTAPPSRQSSVHQPSIHLSPKTVIASRSHAHIPTLTPNNTSAQCKPGTPVPKSQVRLASYDARSKSPHTHPGLGRCLATTRQRIRRPNTVFVQPDQ